MTRKFIPNGDEDFIAMARPFAAAIAREPARFGIADADAAELSAAVERFGETYVVARHGGRSAVATAAKEEARRAAERIVRRVGHLLRANDSLDAVARLTLGLRPRTPRAKGVAVPDEPPELIFQRACHRAGGVPMHELSFATFNRTPRTPGAARLELFADLVSPDAPVPERPGVAYGSRPFYLRSYTRSPIRVAPPLAGVPMRVVYWGRWADAQGNVGPFSTTAVGWVEGGSHHLMGPAFVGCPTAERIEVTQREPSREQATLVVALLEAQGGRRAFAQLEGPAQAA